MTARKLSEGAVRRLAGVSATVMAGALGVACVLGPQPAAASDAAPRPALAELGSTLLAGPSTTLLFMARGAQAPCEAATVEYRAAQAALAGGDIEAADDVAMIARVLIAECGWTNTDAALGGRHGN